MKRLIKVIMFITITFVITSCEGKNSNSLPQTPPNAAKTPEIYVPVSDSLTKNDLTTDISPDAEDMPAPDTVSLSQVDYNEEYNFLISEWRSALNRHINNEYTENNTFDIPTPSPIDGYIWQDVYAEFLRENIPENAVDFNTFIDGSDEEVRFSAFSAGGYPVTPFFYLYDIDKDGVPELIYLDAGNADDGDVYTYKNNSVSKIGSINFYPFGGLVIPLDKTDGLYSDVGYKGNYGEIYLITMNNNILKEQLILEYNNEPEISPQQPGLPYSFNNFDWLDYYEVTESNITKVIYGGV